MHVRDVDDLDIVLYSLKQDLQSLSLGRVIVDDDNVPESTYLETALRTLRSYSYLGTFGAGKIEPEFEVAPPRYN